MRLHGVMPPLGTPLTDGDRVDEAGLRRLVRYLVDAGVHAIFANGSMGGFAFLTGDEQVRSIGITGDEVKGRVPVGGGLGETSTSRAVPLARRIAATGVDAISMLPPFYFEATQQHLLDYFSAIAAATDTPLLLYDNPALTKCHIHPETIARLQGAIPHLIGIKISNPDQANLQAVIQATRSDGDFVVFTGHEFLIVTGLQLGCAGFVGGLHNLCPHMAVALYNAFRANDLARARKLQQDLIATWQIFRFGEV